MNGQNSQNGNSESVEQQLERLLADAESTVASLRRELDGARNRREREAMIRAQHEEIDRLQDHLAEAQVHWGAVREFFEAALRELSLENHTRSEESSRDEEPEGES